MKFGGPAVMTTLWKFYFWNLGGFRIDDEWWREGGSGAEGKKCRKFSPNQVLAHAARAAAKQQSSSHLWWPRAARAKGSG